MLWRGLIYLLASRPFFLPLLSPSFVASGLSTIRSHFSIAFVSASSFISVSSLPLSAASYKSFGKLSLNISCTRTASRLYTTCFCRTYSRPSSACTFYIAFVSPRQQLDGIPHIDSMFSGPSPLSYNALVYMPARSLCTNISIRLCSYYPCQTYSRFSTFCIWNSVSASRHQWSDGSPHI